MTYTVQSGDSLWRIATRHNIGVQDLINWNNLTSNLIRPGQTLHVANPALRTVQRPTTSGVFDYKNYNVVFGGRKSRVFMVKFNIKDVKTEVCYPLKKQRLATVPVIAERVKADLAVNCSFFYKLSPIGRHIKNGKMIAEVPVKKPIIIQDDWEMNIGIEPVSRLIERGVDNCFTSYPTLINNGRIIISERSASLNGANPRTALGMINANEMVVCVVDGRQAGYSVGVNFQELAQIMWDNGCRRWAINLDGGGSSTLYYNGVIKNRPSDGTPRRVVNALCFTKK